MRFTARLKKLEAAAPRCDRGLVRFVRGDRPPPGADRCPGCGTNHVLVVCEVVARTRGDIERVRALNARDGLLGAGVRHEGGSDHEARAAGAEPAVPRARPHFRPAQIEHE